MTQPLNEEEKAILWNAITLPGFQIECINSVVASIADGRATGARLPIAAIVNAWGNAGLTSEKAMEQIAAVLGKPF